MKRIFSIFFLLFIFFQTSLKAQHTFSIVAIDTISGEVGSAGATCLDDSHITGGALIISGIVPGKGAIHVQASYHPNNYFEAVSKLYDGYDPSQIIPWMLDNDFNNTPSVRQYGLAAFDSNEMHITDAFTGINTMDYKGHIIGPNYAIQGNILLGNFILDSMESRFLYTEGTLADKLMAAMQGANVAGADNRCLDEGVSSLSAFLRVAKPTDHIDSLYIDLLVSKTPYGVEPLDSLQKLYNAWKFPASTFDPSLEIPEIIIFPIPVINELNINISNLSFNNSYRLVFSNILGQIISQASLNNGKNSIDTGNLSNGIYFIQILDSEKIVYNGRFIKE